MREQAARELRDDGRLAQAETRLQLHAKEGARRLVDRHVEVLDGGGSIENLDKTAKIFLDYIKEYEQSSSSSELILPLSR